MKVANTILIGWGELSERRREKLFRQLTFPIDGQVCFCYRNFFGSAVEIPRGGWQYVDDLDYVDNRAKPARKEVEFTVQLDNTAKDPRFAGQKKAVEAMFKYEQGQIIRPPGTGKSNIALAFAAKCKTSVLIIVHTKDLMDQWLDYIKSSMPGVAPGVIQGPNCKIGHHITVAMIQSLRTKLGVESKEWWRQWGCVIVDEGHHGAAESYDNVLNELPAYYRFSFTASATRADGMHPYLNYLIGPVIHNQKFSSPIPLKVRPVFTDFHFQYRGRWDWHALLDALVSDGERNEKIADIIDGEVADGHSILVLSRRISHLEGIAENVQAECEILTGTRPLAERRRILADFKSGRIRCLLSTQLADEALDVPRCDRVLLSHPGKHEGRIIQQIGRALRQHSGKKDAQIIDIVDKNVNVLNYQWRQRKQTYHKLRIPIIKRKLVWR